MQDNADEFFNEVADKAHLDSFLIEDIVLVAGYENWILHGLGRKIRGFELVKSNSGTVVYWATSSAANMEKYLPVRTSSNATVSVVVF